MKPNDPADHAMFIDHQASFDAAVGCLAEGHTWEGLCAAIKRMESFWLTPLTLPPARHGGLGLV